ncbi:ATP-binding protein [Nocardioides rubriscoriae]|uniref:ATP-binding protein n=1 Tax=Nocardioides rubriscoriae TaxID=642762 RepID=UPI0014782E6A|nr:ATP-binding protein [Nocardioides rubriscoriae]
MDWASATVIRRALALLVAIGAVDAVLLLGFGPGSAFTSWWSSVGLCVALVAVTPRRSWPVALLGIVVVAGAVRLAFGASPGTASAIAAAHAVQALLGGAALTRLGRVPGRLANLRDLVALLAAATTCGTVALAEPFLRGFPADPTAATLAEVAAQHAVSTVLLCALVLLVHRARVGSQALPELVLQVLALMTVTAVVFSPGQAVPLLFTPLPLLVWACLRFDPGVVALELLGFALAATLATSQGYGPVPAARLDDGGTGAVVLVLVLAAALMTLPLALTVQHRRHLLDKASADEHLFRRTFTESPLGMVLLREGSGDLLVDEVNDAGCTTLGASYDELVGARLVDVLDALDGLDGLDGLAGLRDGDADAWHGHAAAVRRPGSRIEVAVASIDRRDGSRILSAQLFDVTQEHDVLRRLVDAHRLNDATLETTACIVLVTDAHGTVIRANAATSDLTGFSEADLLGRDLWDLTLAPLSRHETEAMFVWPNRSGFPIVSERVGRRADGQPVRVVWNSNVVRDEHGMPSYAVLTGIDVTTERSMTGLMSHLLSASIATALLGVDGSGRITLANTGAAQMLGRSVDDLEGSPFVDLFDRGQLHARTGATGDRDAFMCLVGMIGDRDESPAQDWTWRTRRGHERIVSMTLSVTDDLGAGRVGFLCVGRDVTEQREGQATLVAALEKERTAVEQLRTLDRAKDEFVSTVSHELRTPVTSIIGYTEMLRDGSITAPSPDQVPVLETIARNSQRLVAICNDLLLLSGFESPASVGVRTRVDLRACLAAAHDPRALPQDGQGLRIDVDPGTTPLEVTGDQAQLDRLVANLLSNAVKFTPVGGRVDVVLGRDGSRAVLTVRDTGIGIPESDHEAVFQRFYRSEEAQSRAIPGTGLGLAIVAAIVAAHEGEIAMESEPGRGTTFRVCFPLAAQRAPARAGH